MIGQPDAKFVYPRPALAWLSVAILFFFYVRSLADRYLIALVVEMGYVDEEGYVFITDRVSDMIVSGRVNIYPAEAEQVLLRHPQVRDVAVIGVPNAEMGEEAKALVIPADPAAPPAADELRRFCREHLAGFKCPRSYDIVDDIGRNVMGKINKRELRRPYWPSDRTIGGGWNLHFGAELTDAQGHGWRARGGGIWAMRATSEKPLTYSSPAILARRRRILNETRTLIAEQGIGNFSMNDLCRRAGVAKRTLYNAFQTRERLIATAIQEYFLEYLGRIQYRSEIGTLQRSIERIVAVGRRNRELRNYIRAIMAVYFSPDVIPDIREAMNSVAVDSNLEWIRNLQKRRQLQPWIEPESLANDMVRYEYATIYDWARGLIEDDVLITRLLGSYLALMLGATRGTARAEIEEKLREIGEGRMVVPVPRIAPTGET